MNDKSKTSLNEENELTGWLSLAEESLRDDWDHPQDEATWSKYI